MSGPFSVRVDVFDSSNNVAQMPTGLGVCLCFLTFNSLSSLTEVSRVFDNNGVAFSVDSTIT